MVNDNTVEVVGKKDGKVLFRDTMTVAPDSKTLATKFESHPSVNDQVVTYHSIFSRIGEPEMEPMRSPAHGSERRSNRHPTTG